MATDPVSLYRFPGHTPHLVTILQPGHPAHPGRAETPGINLVPQKVSLKIEFDSLVTDGCHGLYIASLFFFQG